MNEKLDSRGQESFKYNNEKEVTELMAKQTCLISQ